MRWLIFLFLVLLPLTLGQVHLDRKDKELFCVSNQSAKDVVVAPIYKLETINVTKLNTGAWTKLWNASHGTEGKTIPDTNWNFKDWNELPQFATNGTSSHILLADLSVDENTRESFYASVLAQSVSFLLTAHKYWRGNPGLIFQIDHISNKSADFNQFRALKCFKVELKDDECTEVHSKIVELLENGIKWTHLNFSCARGLNDMTSCKISKYGSRREISFSVQLKTTLFPNLRYVAAKAVGKPGIFKLHSTTKFASGYKTLTRDFYQQRGIFCIDIIWNKEMSKTVHLSIYNLTYKIFNEIYNTSHRINTHIDQSYEYAGNFHVHLTTDHDIVTIKNCSTTYGNLRLDYGKDGSEIIGCQKIAEKSNQNPILENGCSFTNKSAFDCEILDRYFSLPCQNLLFCDGKSNTTNEVTLVTTTTVKLIESTDGPTNKSSSVKSSSDEAKCHCGANSIPVSVDFLWGLVGLNFCLIGGVTIWWWIIWEKNDHYDYCEDEYDDCS